MAKKILIVDDEPDALKVLESRLRAGGYEVIQAGDGHTAFEKAKSEQPNLVLLDILMPDPDGIETYHMLGNDPQTASIPVIFLSALAKEQSAVDGGFVIFGKPYDSQALLDEIEKASEGKKRE